MPGTALDAFVASLPRSGAFSSWCGPLKGDAWTTHTADVRHYAASTMKLALVMAAYREAEAGCLDLDRRVVVHNEFRSVLDGSGYSIDEADDNDPEPWRRLGSAVALRWLAYRAIVASSNLATNLVLDSVGTEPIAALLTDVGASQSRVGRGIGDVAARDAGIDNLVTAADLARQLQALYGHEALSAEGSQGAAGRVGCPTGQ